MKSALLDQIQTSLHVLALPLKTRFRGVDIREVALFNGPAGWAEFSPFIEYSSSECAPWLASAIEAATILRSFEKGKKIRANATLPALGSKDQIAEVLSWYPGCRTVKIKVGADLSEDLKRIVTVQKLLPQAKIRVDVNGSWDLATAVKSIRSIYEISGGYLEYVEQPCESLAELRELKNTLGVPVLIAGDEILRKAADPLAIDLQGSVDILIIKVAPLGGINRCKEIIAHHKLPVVVSSALESAVGISYGLRLAASIENLSYDSGLATGALFRDDVAKLAMHDGELSVSAVIPNQDVLKEFAVKPERLEWWRERINQTFKIRERWGS